MEDKFILCMCVWNSWAWLYTAPLSATHRAWGPAQQAPQRLRGERIYGPDLVGQAELRCSFSSFQGPWALVLLLWVDELRCFQCYQSGLHEEQLRWWCLQFVGWLLRATVEGHRGYGQAQWRCLWCRWWLSSSLGPSWVVFRAGTVGAAVGILAS